MTRRTFFSFHYHPDVHRAWNVRNSWVTQDRKSAGFFDSGVFEESKKQGDATLKRFLNDGLKNTSVMCVLAGTNTWRRRWVRYEIQKSFLDGKGILTVYIHTIKNLSGQVASKGENPLQYLAFHIDDNDRLVSMIALMEPPMIGIMAPAEVAENGFPDGFIFRPFAPALQRLFSVPPAVVAVYGTSRLPG